MSDLEPIDGVGLDDFLQAKARVDHAPGEMTAVLATLSLPHAEAWRRIERSWRERLDADPQLGDVAGRVLARYAKQMRSAVEDVVLVEDAPPPEPPIERVSAPARQMPSFMQAPLAMAPAPPAVVAPSVAAPVRAPPVASPLLASPSTPVVGHPALAAPLVAPKPVVPPITAPPEPKSVPSRVPLAQRGTSPVDLERMRAIMSAGPTPFAGKTSPQRLEKLRADSFPIEARATGGSMSKATMMATAAPSTPGKTLPFAADGGGASFPDLTVDRYAALAAELQAKGATASVLARYEIATSAALGALHAEYERRFAARPNLRAYFEERRAHFLAFMAPTR